MQNAKKLILFLIVAFSIESIAQEPNPVLDAADNADNDAVEITSAQ